MTTPEASYKITAQDLSDKAFNSAKRNLLSFSNQAAKLTGVLTGISGIVLFKNIFENTARAEKAMAQLDARIKSTGGAAGFTRDQLVDMSKGLQRISTFGDDAIQEMQALMMSFTNLKGPQFQAAQEAILNVSTAMGVDLASAARQVGKALNDPAQGLSALSRMGIQFSDEQEKVIKKLTETGKTADAQKLILDELEEKFGGAARAARDTFGGALTALKEAAGDLLEADGLGGAKNAVNELTKTLQDPKTVEAAQKLTTALITGFSEVVKVLAEIPNFMEFLGEQTAKFLYGSADPIERVDENIAKVSDRIVELKNIIQSSGAGGYLPPQIEEEFDRLMAKLTQLKKERAMLVQDAMNARPAGAAPAGAGTPTVSAILGEDKPVLGVTDDKVEKELETIRNGLRTKEELIVADFAKQHDFIVKHVEDEAARQDLLERLAEHHQKELTRIQNEGLTQRDKFLRLTTKNKLAFMLQSTMSELAGVAQTNKTLFKINKVATQANILLSAPGAIAEAIKNAGGLPWGAWAGALTAAKYVGLWQAASEAEFGSGGAPSVAGTGSGAPAMRDTPGSGMSPPRLPSEETSARAGNAVNIHVYGNVIGMDQMQRVIADTFKSGIEDEIITISTDGRRAEVKVN